MKIKTIVNGASGRMGLEACKAIEADSTLELVARADQRDNLSELIQSTQADVVVDFTAASCAFENVIAILNAGARAVVGTSGLTSDEIDQIQTCASKKNLGVIIAPNFSIGAILMMRYAQDAARYFNNVEIIELHHDKKEDSPSGTALKTAEMMKEHLSPPVSEISSRETIPGARGASHHNIPIHAVRLPGLVAHQEVMFGGTGETLRIQHDSIHRECFMPGVVMACKKVMELNDVVYGLEKLLD